MSSVNYSKTTRTLGAFSLLALAQIMVGINIVTSKALVTSTPLLVILAVRFIVAAILLFSLHRLVDPHKHCIRHYLGDLGKRDWFFIIAQALTAGVFFNILMLWGLRYTSANTAGIITSSLPALIVLISWPVLKEKFTAKKLVCVSLATIGLLVISLDKISSNDQQSLYGNLIIMLAMLPEAAYYVLTKMYFHKVPVFLASALINLVNAVILLPIALYVVNWHGLHFSGNNILLLTLISTSSAFFFVFWYLGSANADIMLASLSTAAMPVATVTLAWIFLHESISFQQFIGMGLVISSIVAYALPKYQTLRV